MVVEGRRKLMEIHKSDFLNAIDNWIMKREAEGDKELAPRIGAIMKHLCEKDFEKEFSDYRRFETDWLFPTLQEVEGSVQNFNEFVELLFRGDDWEDL